MKILFAIILLISINTQAQVTSLGKASGKKHIKGAEIKFLASAELLNTKNAFVGYLTIPPKGKVPEHRDATEEYLFVIKGSGNLWIDDKRYSIKAKDLVYMPAKAKVRYENDNVSTEVLQIFSGPGPEKKYDNKAWKDIVRP